MDDRSTGTGIMTPAAVPLAWSWRATSWSVVTSGGGDLVDVLDLAQIAGPADADRMRKIPLCWSWRVGSWLRASDEYDEMPEVKDPVGGR